MPNQRIQMLTLSAIQSVRPRDGSVCNAVTEPEDLSLIPQSHMVEGEN